MSHHEILVRCVCGWEMRGTEAVVVPATQEHGRRVHNMTATREDVLAMAVSSDQPSRTAAKPG